MINNRSIRRSSKEDQDFTTVKIINLLENNKLFAHKFNPYFGLKEVKTSLAQQLMQAEDAEELIFNPESSTFYTIYDCLPPSEKKLMVEKALNRMTLDQLKQYGLTSRPSDTLETSVHTRGEDNVPAMKAGKEPSGADRIQGADGSQ